MIDSSHIFPIDPDIERLEKVDFDLIVSAHVEKDRMIIQANVLNASVALCEAKRAAIHHMIVEKYDLKEGDSYNNGVITRVKKE